MDRKVATLVGAISALAPVGAAQAAPEAPAPLSRAASYAQLLAPVPNAVETLKADDETRAKAAEAQVAQYYDDDDGWRRRRWYHHHHHHHDYYWRRRRWHHHHHHHHHHHWW